MKNQNLHVFIGVPLFAVTKGLEISPNPFTSAAIVSFILPEDSHVNMELFDLAGSKIKNVLNENLPEGKYKVELDREQLSAGTYFLQLKMNEKLSIRKIVIE